MTKVEIADGGTVIAHEVVVTTPWPTEPPPQDTPGIGLVELEVIDYMIPGSIWMTGPSPPDQPGHTPGDMWLGEDGDVWQWDGTQWTNTGINISSSDTPQQVLDKIKTVDGAGSGLDADTLDGHDSSYFATDADMDAAASAITGLDDRMDAVEQDNSEQDDAIALRPTDAPSNGQSYGRKNAGWVDVTEEAPADGIAYGRKNGAWVPSVGGAAISDGPPAGPVIQGQLWWESDTGNTYVYYDDGNSTQWVQINGGPGTALITTDDLPPANPQDGMLWFRTDKGILYVYYDDGNSQQWVQSSPTGAPGPVKTAQTRNRVVNGAMQISQENGSTAGTTSAYYPADQWYSSFVSSSTITAARLTSSLRPNGAISLAASPAETAAAAGEIVLFTQKLEGLSIADFFFGVAGSQQAVIAFDVAVPVAGTYWISVLNNAATHTWLGSYTISAAEVNTWVRRSVIIPAGAINTGTWPTDNTASMWLRFCFHCGSTYTGVAGFQSGAFAAGPGQALGLSTATPCYLTNVGLYLDPDNTGLAPPFEVPDYGDELARCQRYWEVGFGAFYGGCTAAVTVSTTTYFKAPKRVSPTISATNSGTTVNFPATSSTLVVDTTMAVMGRVAVAAGGGVYRDFVTANARM